MTIRAPIPTEWKGCFLDEVTYQNIKSILDQRNNVVDSEVISSLNNEKD